jgi:hypothetical protein
MRMLTTQHRLSAAEKEVCSKEFLINQETYDKKPLDALVVSIVEPSERGSRRRGEVSAAAVFSPDFSGQK